MTDNKKLTITLSPEDIAKCKAYVAELAAHYGGDDLHAMPWSRHHVTCDELQQWLESREEAGRLIDIETCELGRWYADVSDPYGIREMLGEETCGCVGAFYFVRSPDSGGWVHADDLAAVRAKAMHDRIDREAKRRLT